MNSQTGRWEPTKKYSGDNVGTGVRSGGESGHWRREKDSVVRRRDENELLLEERE